VNRINKVTPWQTDPSPLDDSNPQDHPKGVQSTSDFVTDVNSASDSFHLWPSPPQPRSYFLPLHYVETYQYPVVVWFHHNGFNEHQIDQIMPHLSTRNYIGIGIRGNQAADSAGHCFSWHDSPAAIDATQEAVFEAIEEASTRFSIHPQRVILAGYQDGGTMAQRIALRVPSKISGVISMGGTLPQGELALFDELRLRKLPMLWQWSSQNPLYNDRQIREDCQLAMSISADLEIRQYADEDEMNTITLKDANEWIMRKVIAGSSISDSNQWSSKSVAYSAN